MQQLLLLLPLALIILVGILSAKFKLVQRDAYLFINKVVIFVAMPALTISALVSLDASQISKFPLFTLANTLAMIVFDLVLILVLSKTKLPYEKQGAFFMSVSEGNVVYFGYPIISGLFGATHFLYAALFVAITLQIVSMFEAIILTKNRGGDISWKKFAIDFFKNPLVLSTFIGFALFGLIQIFPKDLPANIMVGVNDLAGVFNTVLTKLGSMASTLALFSLGVYLYSNFKLNTFKLSLLSSFIRLMVLPAFILLIVLYIIPLDRAGAETSILLACMPTAVFAVIASDVYNYDKNQASNSLIISSIAFTGTLFFWLWILSILF